MRIEMISYGRSIHNEELGVTLAVIGGY
jgi:hypothetical protein